MKLSDAILLGDSLKRSDWSNWLIQWECGALCGCALGGALLASGTTYSEYLRRRDAGLLFTHQLHAKWPWLTVGQRMEIGNRYRLIQNGAQTLEQLVDYVRSVEPAERTFQCPIGDCAFVGTQEEVDDHQLVAHDFPEEEWSDSDGTREQFNSITGRS